MGALAHALEAAAVVLGIQACVGAAAAAFGEVVFDFAAADGGAVLIEREALAGGNHIAALVIIHPFGIEHLIIALHNHIALGAHGNVGLPRHFIGADAGVVGRQRRFAASADFGRGVCRGFFAQLFGRAAQAGAAERQIIGSLRAGRAKSRSERPHQRFE